jgi:hypothetical protein
VNSWESSGAQQGSVLPSSRSIYFKSHNSQGKAECWSIPVTGGKPTLLTRFDDPHQPSYGPEWAIGGGRMFFTVDDPQSDVWVADIVHR